MKIPGCRVLVCVILCTPGASSLGETLTVAGGRITGAATQHDYFGAELNLPWKSEAWTNESFRLDINHAFGASGFHDDNRVYAVSWSPKSF